jgi:bacterioferritin-associated ferredoxin
MYICSCRAVTDATLEAVIAAGARTVEEISERCPAGRQCGGCLPALERLLADYASGDGALPVAV